MKPGKIFLAAVLCAGRLTAPGAEGDQPTIIKSEELKEDVRFLMRTFEEVHPNLYFKTSRAAISQRLKDLNDGLTNSLTAAEFYYRLAPFADGFEDAHTVIFNPAGATNVSNAPFLSTARPNYRWKFEILETNLGYIDFTSMSDREQFQRFLAETFGTIKEKQLAGLIIDLRKNTGGDSRLGDDLLDYITSKPYRSLSRKDWRFSRQLISTIPQVMDFWTPEPSNDVKNYLATEPRPKLLKNLLAQNPSVELKSFLNEKAPGWLKDYLKERAPHWLDPAYSPETQKETLFLDMGELRQTPDPFPLRFKGPVCLLVGPTTFSSAIILGNSAEDFHLATLIGEETRPCNQFGEPYDFKLPYSGLNAWVATAQFVRANGDTTSVRGVLPEIEVRQSTTDRAKEIDTALEAAKRWIQKHR